MNVSIQELKYVITETIKEARHLFFNPIVKFENLKKINDHYEISGTYELRGILTDKIIESGKFKAVLNEELEVISLEITPTKE